MEAQETQNGKGLEKVLDKSRKQSKNHAVERIRTEGVLGNLWMRGHSAAKRVSSTQHVQHEVVFSCVMSIMDAIYGWEDEEKRVGSKFAACMWIYTKEVLTRGQILNPRDGGVPEETNDVHYGMHKLGLSWRISEITNGSVRKHTIPAC